MKQIVADLHLHSRYSQAVSKFMSLETLAESANVKGIDLLSVGDFTHPEWLAEIREKLVEDTKGVYTLKSGDQRARFILGTELSCIFQDPSGESRRVHVLVYLSSFKMVDGVCEVLASRGEKLSSDGRPILGMSVESMCEVVFGVDPGAVVIPAHVWTPWFGALGSKTGFGSLRECFGKYAEKIYAIETGLSSNPWMNWQVGEFDHLSLVSFSDAHSPAKIGRELTVFEGNEVFEFKDFLGALKGKGDWKIGYTIEFPAEEGKYYWDGHRKCEVYQSPEKTASIGRVCPVCGKVMTIGVLGQVQAFDGSEVEVEEVMVDGVRHIKPVHGKRPGYVEMIPLVEILSEVLEVGIGTKTLTEVYDGLIQMFGSEMSVLFEADVDKIEARFGERLAEAIGKVREGGFDVIPGFDGQFGVVRIWGDEAELIDQRGKGEQMGLF